jgi:drug/metabolite transporter (DMT)-like permease
MKPEPAPALKRGDLLVGNGAAVVVMLVWGTNFPLVEQLLLQWDMFSTTASRQLIGALALLLLLWVRSRQFPLRRALPWRQLTLLGIFGPAVSSSLTTLAVATSGSIAVAVIYAMGPLVAALVARVLFAIPLQKGTGIGIALACLGGIIIKSAQLGEAELTGGEGFMLLSLCFWTWYSVAAQRWLKGFSQLEIVGYTMLPGGILLTVLTVVLWLTGLADIHVPLNSTTVPMALFIAVVPIALGNLMWHTGVSRLGVTLMSIFANFVPVIAILLAMWFGIMPTWHHILGGLVILAGVIYAQVSAARALPARS